LNAQHIPLSVGTGLKIAAQGTGFPRQRQDLINAISFFI